jgi:hypothetical protein
MPTLLEPDTLAGKACCPTATLDPPMVVEDSCARAHRGVVVAQFRAIALLVRATLDSRHGRRADGCTRLARAEADMATDPSSFPGYVRFLDETRGRLPRCGAR